MYFIVPLHFQGDMIGFNFSSEASTSLSQILQVLISIDLLDESKLASFFMNLKASPWSASVFSIEFFELKKLFGRFPKPFDLCRFLSDALRYCFIIEGCLMKLLIWGVTLFWLTETLTSVFTIKVWLISSGSSSTWNMPRLISLTLYRILPSLMVSPSQSFTPTSFLLLSLLYLTMRHSLFAGSSSLLIDV